MRERALLQTAVERLVQARAWSVRPPVVAHLQDSVRRAVESGEMPFGILGGVLVLPAPAARRPRHAAVAKAARGDMVALLDVLVACSAMYGREIDCEFGKRDVGQIVGGEMTALLRDFIATTTA